MMFTKTEESVLSLKQYMDYLTRKMSEDIEKTFNDCLGRLEALGIDEDKIK